MKWILSRYNHDVSWIKDYTDDYVIYDRSHEPLKESIVVPNIGSDIFDKFTFIIDNYRNLPDIGVYTKANIFKYITRDELQTCLEMGGFQPLLTQHHKVYEPVCRYKNGLYEEINNYWYLNSHPAKWAKQIKDFFHMEEREYNAFAPGSNYILPRENILRTSLDEYKQLREYLAWTVYPGDAQLMERNLWYLWK